MIRMHGSKSKKAQIHKIKANTDNGITLEETVVVPPTNNDLVVDFPPVPLVRIITDHEVTTGM
jgi:hypothetical protein